MKKFIIVIGLLMVAALATLIGTGALKSKENRMGEVAKEAAGGNKKSAVAIKGKDFKVSEKELKTKVKYFKAAGVEDPEKAAKDSFIEKESLYALAVSKGYSATQQEVDEVVEEIKQGVKEAKNEEIQNYIEGFGSEEEFWEFERELESKNLVIKKYLEDEKKDYLGSGDDGSYTSGEENRWQNHYESIKKKAIKKQKIEISY